MFGTSFITRRGSLFHLIISSSNNSSQIHTSVRFRRNFFNYEQFTKDERKIPPKLVGKFSETYKRRPLFWMIRGTDALKEHNQICLTIAGVSFLFISSITAWAYWRHMNNKRIPGQFIYSSMNRKDTPEREEMFDFQKQLYDMELMANFKMDHFKDFGELKRQGPQINANFDDIYHQGQALRRDESGRDVTKIVESKSLKEFDQALRED
ncbi:hypothetical protein HUG17_8474 [Dermatophagoides farinae]|nr:hypothetical protein HUG17_8474 [Dermatophagoides farinae]